MEYQAIGLLSLISNIEWLPPATTPTSTSTTSSSCSNDDDNIGYEVIGRWSLTKKEGIVKCNESMVMAVLNKQQVIVVNLRIEIEVILHVISHTMPLAC
jgi:hypothetical protein